MKRIFAICSACFLSCAVFAQRPEEIHLWPNGAPDSNGITAPEGRNANNRIINVTDPTITVYPAAKPNGQAVIMCPGGGYVHLSIDHEGHDMAAWFNNQGITYVVLKYRMPNGHNEVILSDIHQAIRLVREHASKWGVRTVGVMGASAGGHMASIASTNFDKDTRPDFQVIFYGAMGMTGGATTDTMVTPETPQAFLMVSADDRLSEQSIKYYQALRKNGVSACLHIYPTGGHGWGFKDSFTYKSLWTAELEKWLREINR